MFPPIFTATLNSENFPDPSRVASNGGQSMPKQNVLLISTSTIFLAAASLLAQNAPPAGSPPPSQAPAQARQEPCWQEAGISASVFRQHEAIEREKHSQVRSVCADTSLSPQQKVERIAQIREAAEQKTDGLISPEQMKALMACREQRMGPSHERADPCAGQGRRGVPPNGETGAGNAPGNSSQPQN
jgi:hypothetical protein